MNMLTMQGHHKPPYDIHRPVMSGFFGMGVEHSSKAMNAGNLIRTTHAFGGSFFFFIQQAVDLREVRKSDTSKAAESLPVFQFDDPNDIVLPNKCKLVGIELTDQSIELPSFRHPKNAAYILGPERGSLSPEMQAQCDYVIKIPMKFCVNVGVAGALVMYDRLLSRGRFPDRPVATGGPDGVMASMAKFSV